MWLIALMLLLMVPMVLAAVVYLLVAAWRFLEALLQGMVGALRLTWRVGVWTARTAMATARWARRTAYHLRDWHYTGSTWAGQYLQTNWLAWANMARRRYIAGQLRRLRRDRVHK